MNDNDLGLALERLVAERKRIGPSPALQQAIWAIPASTPPEHHWPPRIDTKGFTMFSALKFVAAAAIVALFGGFLLAGILSTQPSDEMTPAAVTESPSPMTTEELLSGMVTEEVEPGVLRVVHDGVRDLVSTDNQDLVAGYDDSIWLLREDEFLRLGDDGSHEWPTVFGREGRDFEVGPHGTVWTIPNPWYRAQPTGSEIYRSADGDEWTVQAQPDDCMGFTVAPDGRAWASCPDGTGGRWKVGLLGSGGRWQPLDGDIPANQAPDGFRRLAFTDAGDFYGVSASWVLSLWRYEDDTWGHTHDFYSAVDVGSDGTVWGTEGNRWEDGLARFADGEWSRWTHDELPDMAWLPGGGGGFGFGLSAGPNDDFEVAPDGSIWAGLWRSGDGVDAAVGGPSVRDWEQRFHAVDDGRATCDGVVRFDGETVDHFLPGRCISMDIAADGSVWVLAGADEAGVPDLYVITPEATRGQL